MAAQWTFRHVTNTTSPFELEHVDRTMAVYVQAVGGAIRYRLDGQNPSDGSGMLLVNSGTPLVIDAEDVPFARFVRDSGSAAATLEVHYLIGKS